MTEVQQTKPYNPIDTLAHSLFGFALFAWIPMLVTWILFVISPVSPDTTFAQIRTLIIIGFGILTLVGFSVTVWTFRHQPTELLGLSTKIYNILGKQWLAILLIVILIEANFLAFLTLGNIAPPITNPTKFLLVCWSLLFIGLLLTIHWLNIQTWLTRTQGVWVSIGLMMLVFVVLGGMFIITSVVVNTSGVIGRLQGRLDYRQLEFIDDGNAPTPQQFWAEQGQMSVQWLPYNYWTVAPYNGDYINIDSQGMRFTPSFTDDDTTQKIYFFGGSTMWGEGARDAYTIAGHVAKLLADVNQPQQVMNYGQTGYVSTQDLNLFQAQLALDNVPDVAIFYQGFNDVFSTYLQDITGIPYREHQRVSDVEAGRTLRNGQPVLRLPDGDISTYDWSLVGTHSASAQAIADRWFANIKLIQVLADAYGVDLLVIWQPALFAKDNLIGDESRILEELDDEFIALYQEVDAIVRERIQAENIDNILMLTNLFADDERAIFYDLVHITEIGNLTVAETMLPKIRNFLEN